MAALSQEAELNRACPSVLICSQFGQKQQLKWRLINVANAHFPIDLLSVVAQLGNSALSLEPR
jgi:hypothetical protein